MRKLIRVLSVGGVILALWGAPAAHADHVVEHDRPPRPFRPVISPPEERPPDSPPGATNGNSRRPGL